MYRRRSEERSHLLANTLLNRIHNAGKPMNLETVYLARERRQTPGKGYRRSGLSHVLTAAA
jgi:hypothetical protein